MELAAFQIQFLLPLQEGAVNEIPPLWRPRTIKLYEIPVRPYGRWNVYMRLYQEQRDLGYEAVLVETDRFFNIWDKHNVTDHDSLEYDRKLHSGWTDFHFSQGCKNPVPLAEVGFIMNNSLRLHDGTTRTIWLLTHGAMAFPIACPLQYCDQLHQAAGF